MWIIALACRPPDPPSTPLEGSLPIRHVADAEAAERGRALFQESALVVPPPLPAIGFDLMWVAWGQLGGGSTYWADFRDRYGMHQAPFENDGRPLGIRAVGDLAMLDCYTCHGGTVAGEVVLGVANSTFDMQGLYDDLALLATAGGIGAPFPLEDSTGARGANDAWGLGVQLASAQEPADVHQTFGYQRPMAWWTLKYKDRMYSDGSASTEGYRSMMAMLLAYGVTQEQVAELEPSFVDVQHYLWSHEAPLWPFEPPDPEAVARGRELFDATCAECHGVHSGPNAAYPDLVVPVAEVGTDPLRAERFGEPEAAFVSAFLAEAFTAEALESTGGYLAPPLVGIWARAPYFHNGSVPDLAAVLNPAERPPVWQRTGSGAAAFDEERVGWRVDVPASWSGPETREGREVYDTSRPGLSNAGHPFGEVFDEAERADVLAYLVTL